MRHKGVLLLALPALSLVLSVAVRSQTLTKGDRDLAESMLRDADADVRKHYYDPNLHSVDWQNRVEAARKNIATAPSVGAAVSEVAALLDSLHDSHTVLVLPPRTVIHDYGFQMEMFGERCFVIRVRSGSDAEKKGLKPGDQIVAVNDYSVSRKNFLRIVYILNVLQPQPKIRLTLTGVNAQQRQVEVLARFQPSNTNRYFLHQGINVRVRDREAESLLLRARYFEKGDDLLVVKIPEFEFSAVQVDEIIGKMKSTQRRRPRSEGQPRWLQGHTGTSSGRFISI